MVKLTLVLVVFALVAVLSAEALKCYQCKDCEKLGDNKSKECKKEKHHTTKTTKTTTVATTKAHLENYEDKKGKTTTTEKPDDEDFYCALVKYKSVDGKDEKVARGCVNAPNICFAPENKIIESCQICDKDDCNGSGAGSIQAWTFTALIVVAIAKFFA